MLSFEPTDGGNFYRVKSSLRGEYVCLCCDVSAYGGLGGRGCRICRAVVHYECTLPDEHGRVCRDCLVDRAGGDPR